MYFNKNVYFNFLYTFFCNMSHSKKNSARYKGKAIPLQAWAGTLCYRRLRLPEFLGNRQMKVVRLSALRSGRNYPLENIHGFQFCWRLSQPQGHSAARRFISMKNSNHSIRNQQTVPPRTSELSHRLS